jgi:hypothetical protein
MHGKAWCPADKAELFAQGCIYLSRPGANIGVINHGTGLFITSHLALFQHLSYFSLVSLHDISG